VGAALGVRGADAEFVLDRADVGVEQIQEQAPALAQDRADLVRNGGAEDDGLEAAGIKTAGSARLPCIWAYNLTESKDAGTIS